MLVMAPRFVVLLHESPRGVHWDLMLETGDRLATWDVTPVCEPDALNRLESFRCRAVRLPDHRVAYLDYEGPVSGNRGNVRQLDAGSFETLGPNHYRLSGRFFRGILTAEDSETLIFQLETQETPSCETPS